MTCIGLIRLRNLILLRADGSVPCKARVFPSPHGAVGMGRRRGYALFHKKKPQGFRLAVLNIPLP
jgi:hypothetical protein